MRERLNQTMRVRPAAGRRVRLETGPVLRAEGQQVPRTAYWMRRLRDGDVELIDTTPALEPDPKPRTSKRTKRSSTED